MYGYNLAKLQPIKKFYIPSTEHAFSFQMISSLHYSFYKLLRRCCLKTYTALNRSDSLKFNFFYFFFNQSALIVKANLNPKKCRTTKCMLPRRPHKSPGDVRINTDGIKQTDRWHSWLKDLANGGKAASGDLCVLWQLVMPTRGLSLRFSGIAISHWAFQSNISELYNIWFWLILNRNK